MNPGDRWNPGWQQFMMNQQRAQAGGNRHPQPQPINQFGQQPRQNIERNVQQRRNNAPPFVQNQNRRVHNRPNNNHNNAARREHRNPIREVLTRDDLERIETVSRKNYHTRTALEYNDREDQCWLNILNEIDEKSRQFTTAQNHNGGDISLPSEENICSNLRIVNQNEVIMATRELLRNYGATEQELNGALKNLEIHLRTNALEYSFIEGISAELISNARKLTSEINELDDILRRIDKIRLQK
ncbi:hypothetical protein GCK72_002447 [Caenorhabditis remanei]|uniref:Uncharacterized protein n=1 Tax=Caenorhabditis remanei TaxID=31234 RepID=A0A6A5HRT3_CAERE|nr:hypothetical protein GCK72_002447 [Caenorhabditis remanei]KAF1770628.1 hypothetical protein GCK72_002447 [Caenorhabditis remanei]